MEISIQPIHLLLFLLVIARNSREDHDEQRDRVVDQLWVEVVDEDLLAVEDKRAHLEIALVHEENHLEGVDRDRDDAQRVEELGVLGEVRLEADLDAEIEEDQHGEQDQAELQPDAPDIIRIKRLQARLEFEGEQLRVLAQLAHADVQTDLLPDYERCALLLLLAL